MSSSTFTEVLRELDRRSFLNVFLEKGVRSDSRGFETWREAAVEQGVYALTTISSSTARLGGTVAACGVTVEVGSNNSASPAGEPFPGEIVFSCTISNLCSLSADSSRDRADTAAVERLLGNCFIRSGAVPLDQLFVQQSGFALKLLVNVTFLSIDGNLNDVAVLTVRAALRQVLLPRVSSRPELSVEKSAKASLTMTGAAPLVINRDPISVTCGILESDNIIVDPSEEEEFVCKGLVTVVVDDEGQPCYISQLCAATAHGVPAAVGIDKDQLAQVLDICSVKGAVLRQALT